MQSRRLPPFLAVRRELERELGTPLTDKQWDALCGIGDVGAVVQGVESIETLVTQFRTIEAAFGGAGSLDTSDTRGPTLRQPRTLASLATPRSLEFTYQEAVSAVVAELAREEPGVIAFRREVLHDTLLVDMPSSPQWEAVTDWLGRQLEREKPLLATSPDTNWFIYSALFDSAPIQARVVAGGVLDRLRTLGDQLAERYRWSAAAAMAFVLTDEDPSVDTIVARIQPNHELPALSRIMLTIDPATPPATVEQVYRQLREDIVGRRTREMPPKSRLLAIFATMRPQRASVKEQMELWNAMVDEAHPTWRYEPGQQANFVRDRNAAQRRLVQPPYQLPGWEKTIDL